MSLQYETYNSLQYESCKYNRDSKATYIASEFTDLISYIVQRIPTNIEDVSEGYDDFRNDIMNALECIDHRFSDLADKVRELEDCVHDLKFGRGD